jgi:Subtilase family
MNRFIVAPGELILVSDGAGGVTRMSGTSFAAPLVSGAIALIQDRWPWLKNYPRDVAKIILESAQDLGAPGVDPVYGHGLLDIRAAQSALNFDNLKYYLVDGSSINEIKVETLRTSGLDPIWSASDFYFTAFEKVDSAERDFLIPLSGRLFNGSVDGRAFQKHMHDLFMAWLGNSQGTGQFASLTDSPRVEMGLGGNGWSYAMRGRYQTVGTRHGLQSRLNSTVELTAPNNALSFAVGQGDGALAIAGNHAMQLSTDFDPDTGGVDPLLGFASGGSHLASRVKLGRGLSVAMGLTNQHRDIESEFLNVSDANRQLGQLRLLGDYDASAMNLRADYTMSEGFNFAASYTRLTENRAFFGVRSLDRNDFGKATVSHSMTFAGDFAVTDSLRLFASSTVAKSYADKDAGFRFSGATSTAWQAGFAKSRLIGSTDHLRVTFAQPLRLENATVDFRSVGVVNRETGEKGIITQKLDISQPGDRRHRVEAYYGAGIFDGLGDVALFSSYELRDVRSDIARWTLGAKARIAF